MAASVACRPAPICRGPSRRRVSLRTVSLTGKLTSLVRALARYLDGWYSRERRHSSLGYVSPIVYEHQLRRAA
jgi:transposase InsO family protein